MISAIVMIALVGLIVYLITTFIPMPPAFSKAIYVVASVSVLLWVLWYFNGWSGFHMHHHLL